MLNKIQKIVPQNLFIQNKPYKSYKLQCKLVDKLFLEQLVKNKFLVYVDQCKFHANIVIKIIQNNVFDIGRIYYLSNYGNVDKFHNQNTCFQTILLYYFFFNIIMHYRKGRILTQLLKIVYPIPSFYLYLQENLAIISKEFINSNSALYVRDATIYKNNIYEYISIQYILKYSVFKIQSIRFKGVF
eukprot:TRINITY_DN18510_c0_g1_i1.p1 TRINITY_DN18510_c0_g1~~TRINITY_DN18510_c0_g1_i1.p1  ORF type:complete len:186 (-),score=-15.00 TRINITY_DN18510_c0_g1_i1:61-618(-)